MRENKFVYQSDEYQNFTERLFVLARSQVYTHAFCSLACCCLNYLFSFINVDDYTVLSDAEGELDLESMILAENQIQEDPAHELDDSSDADKENMPPTEEEENISPATKQKVVKSKIQKKKKEEKKVKPQNRKR